MYVVPLTLPAFSVFICVCGNIIKDVMSEYISPILHWVFDGTLGEFNNNSIYSVGFYGTTCRPWGKGTIEL